MRKKTTLCDVEINLWPHRHGDKIFPINDAQSQKITTQISLAIRQVRNLCFLDYYTIKTCSLVMCRCFKTIAIMGMPLLYIMGMPP